MLLLVVVCIKQDDESRLEQSILKRNLIVLATNYRGIMKYILVGLILLIASNVHAGYQEGKVIYISIRQSDGLHHFGLTGVHVGSPPCQATKNTTYWIIKDENSDTGKHLLSMLMMAYAAGKTIYVEGTGKCDRWGDGEDVQIITVK